MKRAFFSLTAITALIVACAGQHELSRSEIEGTIARTDSLMARDDLDSAALLINDLARQTPEDTAVLWQQGIANYRLESVEGRRKAAVALGRLLEVDPDNPRYQLEMGRVLIDQTYEERARDHLFKAIELDPVNETPYLLIADLYLKRFFSRDDRDHADSAEQTLQRLTYNNSHSLAGFCKLAGIEAVRRKITDAKEHVAKALTLDSLFADGNLVAGYASYLAREYERGEQYFACAFRQMDSSEHEGYKSIEYLLTPQMAKSYLKLDPSDRDSVESAFWKAHDLDPTTEVNERQVEHYARVWEANFYYSDSSIGLQGWQTDLGETIIRLGRPDVRQFEIVGHETGDPFTVVWYWSYQSTNYPRVLTFVDLMTTGHFSFPFDHREGLGVGGKATAYAVYSVQPEQSTILRQRIPIDFQRDIYQFRGNHDTTIALIYLSLPVANLVFNPGLTQQVANVEIRPTLQTIDYNTIWHDSYETNFVTTSSPEELAGKYFTDHFNLRATPGRYELAIACEQQQYDRFGLIADSMQMQDFRGTKVAISDLVLMPKRLQNPTTGCVWQQNPPNDLAFTRVFHIAEPVHLYFEIYNLPLDIYSRTRYEVTYTLQLIKRPESKLKSFLGKLSGRKKESVSFTYRQSGASSDVASQIALNVSELPEGTYLLTTCVTDQIFNRSVYKSTELKLIP